MSDEGWWRWALKGWTRGVVEIRTLKSVDWIRTRNRIDSPQLGVPVFGVCTFGVATPAALLFRLPFLSLNPPGVFGLFAVPGVVPFFPPPPPPSFSNGISVLIGGAAGFLVTALKGCAMFAVVVLVLAIED